MVKFIEKFIYKKIPIILIYQKFDIYCFEYICFLYIKKYKKFSKQKDILKL